MKKTVLFYLFLISWLFTTAQNSPPEIPEINTLVQVPNSPEAEAFTRYGNIPISYYTGKPNVSVPIYTVQGKEMSVPVSLSYDASGIKVQSISTSVGAGWNLQAGGMITRQVYGLPDGLISGKPKLEVNDPSVINFNGYLHSLRNSEHGYYLNFEQYEHELNRIRNFQSIKYDHSLGQADLLPDTYSFNAPGISGSVIINPATAEAIGIDNPDIKATYTTTPGGSINSWTITNTDGTVYYFNKAEETTTTHSSAVNEGTRVYNSSWYLTKIESATKKDSFDFFYSNPVYWDQPQLYHNRQIVQNKLSDCDQTIAYDPTLYNFSTTSNLTDFRIKQSILTSITYNDKEVIRFYHQDNRLDLEGRKELDQIDVKYGSKLLKTFLFHQSYFTSNRIQKKEVDYRLKLDSITITGHNQQSIQQGIINNVKPQKYAFDYFGNNELPARDSFSIDALGYYNGKNNTTLIPEYTDKYARLFAGANRSSDFNHRIKGLLEEIHYPTGGSSQFVFDHPSASVSTTQVPQSNSKNLGNVGSGADPNAKESDFSCDDGFWYLPKTVTTSFTVEDEELNYVDRLAYTFNVNSNGNHNQSGRVFFMAIYKSNTSAPEPRQYTVLANGCIEVIPPGSNTTLVLCPGECKEVPPSTNPILLAICYDDYIIPPTDPGIKTFCELKTMIDNGHSDIVYHSYAVPNNAENIVFPGGANYLEAGTYKVFIANSLLGTGIGLTKNSITTVTVDSQEFNHTPFIAQIIDKTNEGETYVKKLDYMEYTIQQKAQLYSIKKIIDNTSANCFIFGDGSYETLERHSGNLYSSTPNEITYPKVMETMEDAQGNKLGSTLYEFYDQNVYTTGENTPFPIPSAYVPVIGEPYIRTNPLNGQLKQVSQYDNTQRLLKTSYSVYDFDSFVATTGTNFYGNETIIEACSMAVPGEVDSNLKKLVYLSSSSSLYKNCSSSNGNVVVNSWRNIDSKSDKNLRYNRFRTRLLETVSKDYYYDANNVSDSVMQKVTYTYGTKHNIPIQVNTTLNQGKKMIAKTQYPQDLQTPSTAEQKLITQHRIATPIHIESTVEDSDGSILSTQAQRTQYKIFHGNIVLPEFVQALKGAESATNVLENRIEYLKYDTEGNSLEVSRANGAHIIYIWGYNDQYPIAKISNATYYSGMPPDVETLINQIKTISNTENSIAEENTMRAKFKTLRDHVYFEDAQITCYTYNPMVGVTSVTDPKGYTMTYHYDRFNRLEKVKDQEENILSENTYNYKNN